jgi:hypothetical protein
MWPVAAAMAFRATATACEVTVASHKQHNIAQCKLHNIHIEFLLIRVDARQPAPGWFLQ